MKNFKKDPGKIRLAKKVDDIEKQEKAADSKEFRTPPYRAVMISVTAILCLAIAAGGIVLTMGVFRNSQTDSVADNSGAVPVNDSASYRVDSFSTDPIYNSEPSEHISANSGEIVTAPPPQTTVAATVADTKENSADDVPEQTHSAAAVRPSASTAVSISERGYDGNVLFG